MDFKLRHYLLAGWVATIAEWENFDKDWAAALNAPPKVDYSKHNAAIARKKAFAGLTEDEGELASVRLWATG
jgi:hypothetical protein